MITTGNISLLIAIYLLIEHFITSKQGKSLSARIIDLLKEKTPKEKLQELLQSYKIKKHLVQNPHHRTAAIILDNIQILPITLFFIATINYATYDLYTSFSKIFEHSVKPPEIIFVILILTIILSKVFIKLPFGNIAPLYHFKTFHQLTICEIYNILKKIKNTSDLTQDDIKDIQRIAKTCLEKEFPENELTNLGLAFFTKTYDYPKVMKKEMKKKNYNFNSDKEALITFTEKLLEERRDEPTTPHAA